MDLQTMINDVLPEGSILYKHNHGLFDFFKDDRAFEDGKEFLSQKLNEEFTDFIKRIIKALMEVEIGEEMPSVSIDYAINKSNATA